MYFKCASYLTCFPGQYVPWGTGVLLLLHCYGPNSASRKDAGVLDLMGCNALRKFISNNYCIISGCNKTSSTTHRPSSSRHTLAVSLSAAGPRVNPQDPLAVHVEEVEYLRGHRVEAGARLHVVVVVVSYKNP